MNPVFSKMQLRLTIMLLVIVALFFTGCEKNKGTDYFIRYKVNGRQVNWTDVQGNLGPHVGTNGRSTFTIKSWDPDKVDAFNMYLDINSPQFETTTYANTAHSLQVEYRLNVHQQSEQKFVIFPVTGKPAPEFSITLTAIFDGELRGTFDCNYLAIDGTDNFIEITDGEFVIPNVR